MTAGPGPLKQWSSASQCPMLTSPDSENNESTSCIHWWWKDRLLLLLIIGITINHATVGLISVDNSLNPLKPCPFKASMVEFVLLIPYTHHSLCLIELINCCPSLFVWMSANPDIGPKKKPSYSRKQKPLPCIFWKVVEQTLWLKYAPIHQSLHIIKEMTLNGVSGCLSIQ